MKNYIIDIDGTILNGTTELNNACQFIQYLQDSATPFLLATNSIKSHDLQLKRLAQIGISIPTDTIYSPVDAINKYLTENHIHSAFIAGTADESSQIKTHQTSNSPEIVILLDFEKCNSSYNDIQKIVDYVEGGSKIITASRSSYYLKENKKQIDTGAFVSLIEAVIGLPIPVLGKPSRDYFLNAQSLMGTKSDDTVVIGDDWKTDIQGANEVGFNSVLIQSGKYRRGDEIMGKPNTVIKNLMDLII